jgi:hypothetical protein
MITCNTVFFHANVTLESDWICEYINYHITMLVLFGSMSACFSLITLLMICARRGMRDPSQLHLFSIRYCMTWTLTTALLATGFEVPILLFYVAVTILAVHVLLFACVNQALRCIAVPTTTNSTRVTAEEIAVYHSSDTTGDTAPQQQQPVCSICLDTNSGPLTRTRCKHVFHADCLERWRQKTCPLCRQEV